MTIEKLYPCSGDHAVQNAAFVVEWLEPLKNDTLVGTYKLASKFRNQGLPDVSQQSMLEVNFNSTPSEGGNAQQPTSQVSHGLGGVVFSRPSETGGVPRTVSISKLNCIIIIPDYSRWDQVWNDVQSYLKIVLEEIAPIRPLSVIGLQYTDAFNWKDDPSELDLAEIFTNDSYIPSNVFKQKGLWHLHHGYMESHTAPTPHARLENINVDMIETGGERTIQIIGSHRATLNSGLWQSHLKNKKTLFDMFTSLHEANKEMLQNLLTSAICEKINLTAS